MNEKQLEDEYVVDRMGTVWRAIDVFKTGETQGARNERQRIIKLLETYIAAYGAPEERIARTLFARAINEIRGERAGLNPSYTAFDEMTGEKK